MSTFLSQRTSIKLCEASKSIDWGKWFVCTGASHQNCSTLTRPGKMEKIRDWTREFIDQFFDQLCQGTLTFVARDQVLKSRFSENKKALDVVRCLNQDQMFYNKFARRQKSPRLVTHWPAADSQDCSTHRRSRFGADLWFAWIPRDDEPNERYESKQVNTACKIL